MKTNNWAAGPVVSRMLAATIAAATLSLASCGGSGSESGQAAQLDGEQQALADAIADYVNVEDEDFLSPAESQCFANEVVSRLGTDRLAKMGVTPETPENFGSADVELSDRDADAIVDSLAACIDLRDEIGKSLPDDQRSCVLDNLDDSDLREIMAATMRGDLPTASDDDPLRDAMRECLVTG